MAIATADADRVERIKKSRDMGEYVEFRGIELHPKRGRVRQGLCPFHNEENGSFTVYADSQRFYCFGCDARGDIIEFIQQLDRLSFGDALAKLQTVTEAPTPPAARYQNGSLNGQTRKIKRDMPVVCASLEFYRDLLLNGPTGQPGRDYLKSRGISRATAESLYLGYCSGTGLMDHLSSCDFDLKRIMRSELFRNKGTRERFTGMIVVPEVRNGQPLWATGRIINDEASPKFDALPGSKTILGVGSLPRRVKDLVVAEGVFDWLTLKEWGFAAVGLAGNGNVPRLVEQLNRISANRVIIALDANIEGQALTSKLLGQDEDTPLPQPILNASAINLPAGFEDIGDMATAIDGRTKFLQALA